jgi:diguanylate cyclase (GGDEF)-like protein
VLNLADGRQLLFGCVASPDGGRILTYTDISRELRQEASSAVERTSAELRFNSEMLEEHGAHLAALAEAAEESAQRADAARGLLEHEITQRRQLEIKLRRLATTDGLTGVLNRSEFLASAEREMDARKTSEPNMVVLMIDVDHFKAINDRFGHAGGDRALTHLVTTLRAGLRQIDLLGRLGGEEFGIMLLDTPLMPAKMVAERLRARVAEVQIAFADRLISMTISIGLAVQLDTDESIEQVLARADGALYQAKRSGRNQVVAHEIQAA